MIEAWKKPMELNIMKKVSKINVWSDGGPHHFKITPTLYLFSIISKIMKKKIRMNFFEAYHGHSVCDASAAHLKQIIKRALNDKKAFLKSPQEISNESSKRLKNH